MFGLSTSSFLQFIDPATDTRGLYKLGFAWPTPSSNSTPSPVFDWLLSLRHFFSTSIISNI